MQTPTSSSQTSRREQILYLTAAALAALLAVGLAAHAYVGFYTRYMADDYCTAGTVRTAGLLTTQTHFYTAWSGRFSFTLTVSLFELLGAGVVPFLPLAALVCWLAATVWAVYELLSKSLGRRPLLFSFLVAELIVYATVADNTGGVFEALYWQTGMLTYTAPLIILTALAALYAREFRRVDTRAPGAASIIAVFAVAFYAGGFSETSALMQIGALACAVASTLFLLDSTRRRRLLPSLIAGLSGSIVSLALVALAPGNSVREASLPARSDLFTAIARTLSNELSHAVSEHNYGILFSPRWAALLLATLLSFYLSLRAGVPEGSTKRWRRLLWLSASGLFVYFCCFFPASYAMSVAPPPRALIVAQLVLVCMLVSLGWIAGGWAGAHFARKRLTLTPTLNFALAALALLLSLTLLIPMRQTFSQVSRARALARLWDLHDAGIRARIAGGERNLNVPVAYNIGGTDVMTGDPKWYVNHCFAVYYGADSVMAVPDREGLAIVVGEAER